MKRGITFLSIMVAVIALSIITATIVISVPNIIESSRLKAFATELMEVQLRIDSLGKNYSEYITNDVVVDISSLTDKSIFNGITENNKVTLHQINLNALGLQNTIYGKMKTSKDIYCVNIENGVVYYIEGFETPDTKYYALDSNLVTLVSGREDLTSNVGYNVIFIPSTYVKSADAIKVIVKVPRTATGISVTASGDIAPTVSSATSVGNYKQYTVNTASAKGNYTVTVSYTINGQSKTSTYVVDKYYAPGVYAILYSDGELRINNDGKVDDYKLEQGSTVSLKSANIASSSSIPWSSNVTSIKKVTFENEVSPTYITKWFSGCTNLTQINNMEYLDTSKVTSMKDLFKNCSSLINVDLTGFNTSKVTTMETMFYGCTNLKSLDLSSFNSPKLTSMKQMFNNCTNLETLNLTGFSTPNAVNTSETFYACRSLKELDLSGITKITTLYGTFRETALTKIDLRHIDTTRITAMQATFDGCMDLEEVYLNGIDTSKVTSMSYCFRNCKSLETLDLSSLNTNSNKNCQYLFLGCSNLKYIDLSNFSTSNVTSMNGMFRECSVLNNIDTSGFVMTNCTTTEYMFSKCYALETIDLTGVTTSKVQKATSMFADCTSLVSVDARNWSSTALNAMTYMFSGSNKLKTIYINSLNNLSSTYMNNAFNALKALEYLDIRSLSFDSVASYGSSFFAGLNKNATIIVADDSAKTAIKGKVASFLGSSNNVTVKTVAEL